MVLNILGLALVLAITFMHSTFGFFSGMINLFCVLIGMVVAFGAYEVVTDSITGGSFHAAYTGPLSLMMLFFLTVLILRSAADSLIRGNVVVAQWLDATGAVFCGFINAQVTVGILLISVMMLPLGSSVLGFERLTRGDGRDPDHDMLPEVTRNSLWLRSDEMTVSMFNWLSEGSMRGGTAFTTVYPDFVDAVSFSGNTVQVESSPAATRDKNGDGFKEGLKVIGLQVVDASLSDVRYRRDVPSVKKKQPAYERLASGFTAAPGMRLIQARLGLNKAGGDRVNTAGRHIFRPTMIRMVGDNNGEPEQYYPQALANADDKIGNNIRVVDFDNNFSLRDQNAEIDAYFEVPETFQPRFIEYRRYARAEAKLPVEGEEVALGELTAQKTDDEVRAAAQAANRTFGTLANTSAEQDLLPFGGAASRQALGRTGLQFEGDLIKGGRVTGDVDRYKGTEGGKVERLWIPPNKAMVQVIYNPKEAQSIAGDVFNFVGQINQYRAVDDRGDTHTMAGYYGKVKRRGADYIELFYNGAPDNPVNPSYAGMLDFKDLKQNELNDSDDAEICMIFLVPKGVTVIKVENQGGEGGELNIPTTP